MKVLAFDTANNNNDVLVMDGDEILSSHSSSEPSRQAEMLIPSIEKCLKEAGIWYEDLDVVATTKGPGSFTGIRIGFVVAKTIGFANSNIKLVTLNNLEVAAYDYKEVMSLTIFVVMDAKLDEFFVQEFTSDSGIIKESYPDPKLIKQSDIGKFKPKNKFVIIGSGKHIASNILNKEVDCEISQKDDFPKVQNIALLALEKVRVGQEIDNEILYLRKPNISKPKN